MPVLNESRCLAHILAHTQALGFDEVIIVDGGSSDDTFSIAQHSPSNVIQIPYTRADRCVY